MKRAGAPFSPFFLGSLPLTVEILELFLRVRRKSHLQRGCTAEPGRKRGLGAPCEKPSSPRKRTLLIREKAVRLARFGATEWQRRFPHTHNRQTPKQRTFSDNPSPLQKFLRGYGDASFKKRPHRPPPVLLVTLPLTSSLKTRWWGRTFWRRGCRGRRRRFGGRFFRERRIRWRTRGIERGG